MTITAVSDILIPSVWTKYLQLRTEAKSRLVKSGLLVRDPALDALLAGGGKTFDLPKFKPLATTSANIGAGATGSPATPLNIGTAHEVGVRLSRNQAFGSVDLAADLAGDDPMDAIATQLADYWEGEMQRALIATAVGVFAGNTADNSADYTYDGSNGGSYSLGVSTFSAEMFLRGCHTMGDSESDIRIVAMHSTVYLRCQINGLIDFVSDAVNVNAERIPTFLGRQVIVDDTLPNSAGVYQTWLFGAGAFRMGMGAAKVPIEMMRQPLDDSGAGSEYTVSRVEWMIHPLGHAYAATAPNGGPTDASSSNNLAHADTWNRVYPERKQVKIARILSTEA